jgi:hypothetical protein
MDRRSFLGAGVLALLAGTERGDVPEAVREAISGISSGRADVVWAATISDLRTSTPEEPALGVAAGYRKEDDGGGGLFAWNPASQAPEDGGTVFGPAAEENHRGRWRRLRRREDVFNVRHFGAHPDQPDNASAIQAAIDAAASAKGAVHVPDGTYRVASGLMMQPHTEMRGSEGGRTIIQKTTQSVGPDVHRYNRPYDTYDEYAVDSIVSVDNPGDASKFAKGVVLQNLQLRGKAWETKDKEDRSRYGLYAPRLFKGHFRNVTVSGVSDGFYFREIIVSSVEDCVATQVDRGFVVPTHKTGGGTSTRFDGCYTTRTDRWGYHLKGMSYTTLQGCACDMAGEDGNGGGYFLSLGRGISVISCGCESTSVPALRIEDSHVSVTGFKTYNMRGAASSYGSYLHVKSATVSFLGCVFDELVEPNRSRNARILDGSSVAFVHSGRPRGGRDDYVDDNSHLTVLDRGELHLHGAQTAAVRPDGIELDGQQVVHNRQPAVGHLEGLDDVDASGSLQALDEADPRVINANFARLQESINQILSVLGKDGHGLTDDEEVDRAGDG